MRKYSQEFPNYLYESLEDKIKDKLSTNYSSLKGGILSLIEKSVNDSDKLVEVQNFIGDYIKNPNSGNLIDFVEDNDIFDFYLKYQVDIDQLCQDKKYFDEKPSTKNIFSLYTYIIEGCKFAVIEGMKLLQTEIF
jgi:hypothetical protein